MEKIVTRLPRFAEKKELTIADRAKLEEIIDRIPDATASPADSAVESTPATPSTTASPAPNPVMRFDNTDAAKDPFGAWLEKRVKEKVGEDGTKAQLFLDTLRSNIPTMMLFCIPLFAFILKILYLFQRRYYIEHLVYALHIHAFAYMAAVVITLIGMGTLRLIPSLQPLIVVVLSAHRRGSGLRLHPARLRPELVLHRLQVSPWRHSLPLRPRLRRRRHGFRHAPSAVIEPRANLSELEQVFNPEG